jgi:protein TonB
MRTYTLLFSIAAHALIAIAVVGATLIATDVLPEPRRASEVLVVTAAVPRVPSPTRHSTAQSRSAPAVSEHVAPLTAAEGVRPETGLEPLPDPGNGIGLLPIGMPGGGAIAIDVPPPPPPPAAATPPLRVASGIRPPQKVHDVPPIYPALAQAARVSGVVILDAVIGEDGSVANVRVLRSIPLLDRAAADAVRQWRFTPTLLNGKPVSVIMTVTVSFTLH